MPGYFSQTHDHPELRGVDLLAIVMGRGIERGKAMAALRRYGIAGCAQQPFETLSGGQQARLQILLLELAGSTLLLLDEPTDNLDLASADRTSVGSGKSVSVRVYLGCRRLITKKQTKQTT